MAKFGNMTRPQKAWFLLRQSKRRRALQQAQQPENKQGQGG